jgi:NitT/TauT family transport system permease protein
MAAIDASATAPVKAGSRFNFDALLVALVILVVWQILHWIAGSVALASPLEALTRLVSLLGSADFYVHVRETGSALGQAALISMIGGLAIGVILGAHKLSGAVAEPILIALYSIPKVTLYPLILLFFGLGMSAKVAFGAIHGIIPVVIFTMNAVRTIPGIHLKTAKAMKLDPLTTARTILIPSCLPEIVTGFRIGFALTILGTLIGELFASQRGIGYMLLKAMHINDTATILALAALLYAFAVSVSAALLWLERSFHHRAA